MITYDPAWQKSRIYLQNVTKHKYVDHPKQKPCCSSIKIKLTECKIQPNTRDSNISEMCDRAVTGR